MNDLEELEVRLGAATDQCWKCSNCGYVTCYTVKDIAEYGEPSECNRCCYESLCETVLTDGLAALADVAIVDVRKAERKVAAAKAEQARIEAWLGRATAQSPNEGGRDHG